MVLVVLNGIGVYGVFGVCLSCRHELVVLSRRPQSSVSQSVSSCSSLPPPLPPSSGLLLPFGRSRAREPPSTTAYRIETSPMKCLCSGCQETKNHWRDQWSQSQHPRAPTPQWQPDPTLLSVCGADLGFAWTRALETETQRERDEVTSTTSHNLCLSNNPLLSGSKTPGANYSHHLTLSSSLILPSQSRSPATQSLYQVFFHSAFRIASQPIFLITNHPPTHNSPPQPHNLPPCPADLSSRPLQVLILPSSTQINSPKCNPSISQS